MCNFISYWWGSFDLLCMRFIIQSHQHCSIFSLDMQVIIVLAYYIILERYYHIITYAAITYSCLFSSVSTINNRNISLHDTVATGWWTTVTQEMIIFTRTFYGCVLCHTWRPWRRCGTPSFCSSIPTTTSLEEGEDSRDSEGSESDDAREDRLGEECGDGLDGGWMFFGVFFKIGETNVDDEEV